MIRPEHTVNTPLESWYPAAKKAPVCRTVSAFCQVTLRFTQLNLYFDLLIMKKGCCLYLL